MSLWHCPIDGLTAAVAVTGTPGAQLVDLVGPPVTDWPKEILRLDARIRELEAALRSVPRYAFPGQEEFWAKIDVLLGDAAVDRGDEHG